MEILIIHTKDISSTELVSMLASHGNKVEHWYLDQKNRMLEEETQSHLKSFTHYLYIGSSQDFTTLASMFLLGFFFRPA
jgi:hypothetical protein